MPTTTLRTGAAKPATKTQAPAADKSVQPVDPHAEMRKRLETMGMTPEAIDAAISTMKDKPKAAAPEAPAVPETNGAEQAAATAEVVDEEPVDTAPEPEGNYDDPFKDPVETTAATGADPAPAAEEDHEPEETEERRVVVNNHWSAASGGALSGDIDRSDFKLPQFKIIQGNGPETVNYTQGEITLVGQVLFRSPTGDKPTEPIRFIPITLQKYFRENLESGSKLKPRNAMTREEVSKLGGSLEFTVVAGKRIKPTWSPAAKVIMLLEKPEKSDAPDHPGFTIEISIGGKTRFFAPAVFYVNGGAYRSFAKSIIDATNFILKTGDKIVLHKRVWKMQIYKKTSGEFTIYTPEVTILNELTPPELLPTIEGLSGAKA